MGEKEQQHAIRQGEKRLEYRWQINYATDYMAYTRTGDRKAMEEKQKANNIALSELVLAELAEGKGRFIDPILNGIWMECERTSWVLGAHLHRQVGGGDFPDYHQQIIDLGSGEVAGMLAWTYYLLGDEIRKANPMIADRLRDELHRRITVPYMTRDKEWWLALDIPKGAIVNNWNPWCNHNVLQTMLLIGEPDSILREATWRSMRSVDQFIHYVKSDGACEEGPSYWGHAAGKLFDYLDLLRKATGGKVDIFDDPQIRAMGEYIMRSHIGNSWVVNFADATAQYQDNLSTLMYRYGTAISSPELQAFAQQMAEGRKRIITGGTDMYRTLEGMRVKEEVQRDNVPCTKDVQRRKCTKDIWYPETEVCYMRAGEWFVASKGGHNHESHNHNDVGTCIIYKNAQPVLIDAGVGTYTKQTFSNERYQIWTMQSGYHNLPTINGVDQHDGAEYRAKDIIYNTRAHAISYDIADAYPKEAGIKTWRRGYAVSKDGVTISDRSATDAAPTKPTILHWMTATEPTVENGKIRIPVGNESCTMTYDARQWEVSIEPIELTDPRLSKVWGERIYRINMTNKNTSKCQNYSIHIR